MGFEIHSVVGVGYSRSLCLLGKECHLLRSGIGGEHSASCGSQGWE